MMDQATIDSTRESILQWGGIAQDNSVIYTFGFVSFVRLSKEYSSGNRKVYALASLIALFLFTFGAIVIQTVIPIAIIITLELPNVCPNRADPLTKFIGLILCLFFVVVTISVCMGKMRGMAFLRLFCAGHGDVGFGRLFLDLGILSNLVSMVAACAAQFLFFIRNADRDYVSLLFGSLSMQFVLAADQRILTKAWSSSTDKQIEALIKKRNDELRKGDFEQGDGVVEEDAFYVDEAVAKRARLMVRVEFTLLVTISVMGIAWSTLLTYCM